jgi:NitT/TauT family transport system permease protein
VLLPIAALVVLVLIWQFYVSLGVKRRDLVPGPLDVVTQMGVLWNDGKLQESVWTSMQRGVVGFVISVAIATLWVCCWPRWLRSAGLLDR